MITHTCTSERTHTLYQAERYWQLPCITHAFLNWQVANGMTGWSALRRTRCTRRRVWNREQRDNQLTCLTETSDTEPSPSAPTSHQPPTHSDTMWQLLVPPSEQHWISHNHTIQSGESRYPTGSLCTDGVPHNDITPQDMVCKCVCVCVWHTSQMS